MIYCFQILKSEPCGRWLIIQPYWYLVLEHTYLRTKCSKKNVGVLNLRHWKIIWENNLNSHEPSVTTRVSFSRKMAPRLITSNTLNNNFQMVRKTGEVLTLLIGTIALRLRKKIAYASRIQHSMHFRELFSTSIKIITPDMPQSTRREIDYHLDRWRATMQLTYKHIHVWESTMFLFHHFEDLIN